jgi:uncharacterized protein (DUF1684 family)
MAAIALLASSAGIISPTGSDEDPAVYKASIAKWRQAQEDDLKRDEGWLSVAGLFWLTEGDNAFGTASSNLVRFPDGTTPAKAGLFKLHDGKVTVHFESNVDAKVNGKEANDLVLKPDTSGSQDKVKLGSLTFGVIQRGNRIGIRLWDSKCPGRTGFKGLHWFPVNTEYRIVAQFVPYDPPKQVPITNVLGDTAPVNCPGYVRFTLHGKECRLDAQGSGGGLFINFRDLTTGKSTYPAGRFLDAPKPENGQVTIDFNQATNPPCAYTEFATCPLPPRQNWLDVEIPAGEKTYHGPGSSSRHGN